MIDFYCIHKNGDISTQEPFNDAIESGKQHGINVISYNGVYENIDQIINKEKLFINKAGAHKIRSKGVLGCFLSHYFLWKMSYERNIPIGVLEYDAIIVRDLPNDILNHFTDYLHLDYTRHTHLVAQSNGNPYLAQLELEKNNQLEVKSLKENSKAKGKNLFKYINNNHIRGAFGYIIKPVGAKKLINATMEYGILPAEVHANLAYCDLKYTTPSAVTLNPKGLANRFGGSHTNHDRTR